MSGKKEETNKNTARCKKKTRIKQRCNDDDGKK